MGLYAEGGTTGTGMPLNEGGGKEGGAKKVESAILEV